MARIDTFTALMEGDCISTEIRVGLSNATQFEVLSGVNEGDFLALPGDTALRNNMAVRVAIPESESE